MPPLSIMIKPASSSCNMACYYCFYHDVSALRELTNFGVMSPETSDALIESAFLFASGESVSFTFQGGEPLLAGMDYFKHFLHTVKRLNTKNSPVHFSLQTNGTNVTSEWAEFFAKNNFLVGLSLDGNFEQNKFRVDKSGKNQFDKIIKTARLFEKHGVEFNVLAVLTGYAAENIVPLYRFLTREQGFRHIQFIPCLRPFGDTSESEMYMTSEQYAHFLTCGFELYARDYLRGEYVSVRQFNNFVRLFQGQESEQCGMSGHCSFQFVVEGNGNVYPCDFYCLDSWLLGNINVMPLQKMAQGNLAKQFIQESLSVDERCKTCAYFSVCRGGGCKRTRADRDYCKAYKKFFRKSLPLFRAFQNESTPHI